MSTVEKEFEQGDVIYQFYGELEVNKFSYGAHADYGSGKTYFDVELTSYEIKKYDEVADDFLEIPSETQELVLNNFSKQLW